MNLTERQIKDFQELYKKHFGLEINREEALEKGVDFALLVKSICQNKIHHKPDYKNNLD